MGIIWYLQTSLLNASEVIWVPVAARTYGSLISVQSEIHGWSGEPKKRDFFFPFKIISGLIKGQRRSTQGVKPLQISIFFLNNLDMKYLHM